jgi:hypothetical protein
MTRKIQLFCLFTSLSSGVAIAATPVAYVYVQPPVGGAVYSTPVYVYAANSAGKITQIEASPIYDVAGAIIGTNGKIFVTSYLSTLYSSEVSSKGVIGATLSSIDTNGYTGCGNITGAVLDHSGKFVWTASSQYDDCNILDKWAIGESFGFQQQSYLPADPGAWSTLPTFSGTKATAVGVYYDPEGFSCSPFFYEGPDIATPAIEDGPTPPPGYGYYAPIGPITNDPTDHLAVAMAPISAVPYDCGSSGSTQLASYTVSHSGADYGLTTSNIGVDMPTVPYGVNSMSLNPAGTVLAVATGTGIQFFHFNGSKPITEFTGIIGTSGYITTMAWDKDNHLYAINGASGRLHVYEATTKLVKEVSGSPYNNVCGSNVCTLVVRDVP